MQYAICENGGMTNEIVRSERFDSKSEADLWVQTLQEIEDTLVTLDASDSDEPIDDDRTTFDVVGILDDGSVTTEI